jgi:putative transposase
MVVELERRSFPVNRKRVQRLMRIMGIEAIYPKPKLSQRNKKHKIYPYLLRDVMIDRPNQVWSTDITYVPLQDGFMYLTAVIDWYSRYVISWRVSNTLDSDFCVDALEDALNTGTPDIFNTDQGAQFTSKDFTTCLVEADVKISMDGKGRALDNIFVERLWRSVKYENIYLKDYRNGADLYYGMEDYFSFYNTVRPHQSLENRVPADVHCRYAACNEGLCPPNPIRIKLTTPIILTAVVSS